MVWMERTIFMLGSEEFQRLLLRRRRKRKEAQILVLAMGDHFLQELVILVKFLFGHTLDFGIFLQCLFGISQSRFQLQRRRSSLGAMRLIDNDSEVLAWGRFDLLVDDWELLECRDDESHAIIQGGQQVL